MAKSYRLAAVILAAGQSKRFGKENKLLHEVEGSPLLGRVLAAFAGAGLEDIVVVLGHEAAAVGKALEGSKVRTVVNPRFKEGMGSSLACGVAALEAVDVDGVFLCLGDLPQLAARHVGLVSQAFCAEGGSKIIVPVFEGVRGHPVCLPHRFIASLTRLSGDEGAKRIIAANEESVHFLEMPDSACIQDMDFKEQ